MVPGKKKNDEQKVELPKEKLLKELSQIEMELTHKQAEQLREELKQLKKI